MSAEKTQFYILVGKGYDYYLYVNPIDGQNFLSGVTTKDEASLFRVERDEENDTLYYLAFGEGEDTMYLARNLPSSPTGNFSLQMGGDPDKEEQGAIEFTLHSPGPGDAAATLETWKTKPCCIKFGSGYGAYNEEEEFFEFVEEIVADDDYCYSCRLQELEAAGDLSGQRAPRGPKPVQKAAIVRKNRPRRKRHQFGSE